jgi:hypothetical protein
MLPPTPHRALIALLRSFSFDFVSNKTEGGSFCCSLGEHESKVSLFFLLTKKHSSKASSGDASLPSPPVCRKYGIEAATISHPQR